LRWFVRVAVTAPNALILFGDYRKRGVPIEPTTLLRWKGVDGSKSPG
jgi:hypothetical protein